MPKFLVLQGDYTDGLGSNGAQFNVILDEYVPAGTMLTHNKRSKTVMGVVIQPTPVTIAQGSLSEDIDGFLHTLVLATDDPKASVPTKALVGGTEWFIIPKEE